MPQFPLLVRMLWSHPANRHRRFRAMAKVAWWQVYKRTAGGYWDAKVFGQMRLRCYPSSSYALQVLYFDLPDYHGMKFMQHYLRPGDHFLDVGANVGAFTLLAASLIGPSGEIDAFEPAPVVLARLRENLTLNGLDGVTVHPVAVGAEPGAVQFVADQDGLNHIFSGGDEDGIIEVPCVRLDEEVGTKRYALGKMDIEGAEPLALQGATEMLSRANPPVWLIEMHGLLQRYGFDEQQFADWLKEIGYDLAIYHADRRELCFTETAWMERNSDNVLLVARSAKDQVLRRLEAHS